jgi:transcriptional regulator with XRE-family HTH domain
MKTNKKLKQRLLLQKEIVKTIDDIKSGTKEMGLMVLDEYFAKLMGVSINTIWNMREGRTVGTEFQLKKRLKVAKALYEKFIVKKIII